jgi:hypothetical protein
VIELEPDPAGKQREAELVEAHALSLGVRGGNRNVRAL